MFMKNILCTVLGQNVRMKVLFLNVKKNIDQVYMAKHKQAKYRC